MARRGAGLDGATLNQHSSRQNQRRTRNTGPARRRRIFGLITGVIALVIAALIMASFSGRPAGAADATGGVRIIPVEGVIDPVMADFVTRGIGDAERDGTGTVVLRLDSPGGLDQSMRDIIKNM
ncbi:MAG: hypothetical protein AABZ63_07285, partial [Actinomycetota bacterium]